MHPNKSGLKYDGLIKYISIYGNEELNLPKKYKVVKISYIYNIYLYMIHISVDTSNISFQNFIILIFFLI